LTGWELVFLGNNGDISLKCSDIEIPSIDIWWKALARLPVDIGDCHGRDDIIVAMLLTSNVCRHNVVSIVIQGKGDIHLDFENGAELIVKGRTDPVDWTWDLLNEAGKHILKCEFGEVLAP